MRKRGFLSNDHPTFRVLAPTVLSKKRISFCRSESYRYQSLWHFRLVFLRFGRSHLAVAAAILEMGNPVLGRQMVVAMYHLPELKDEPFLPRSDLPM